MKKEIINNMNESGGGLAHNITGKYESNRHALAKQNFEKRTAGEVAESLRKKGIKIIASDIKPHCEEWHHAGFYKGNNGRTMSRTYFTKKTDEEILRLLNINEKN